MSHVKKAPASRPNGRKRKLTDGTGACFVDGAITPKPKPPATSWWVGLSRAEHVAAVQRRFPEAS